MTVSPQRRPTGPCSTGIRRESIPREAFRVEIPAPCSTASSGRAKEEAGAEPRPACRPRPGPTTIQKGPRRGDIPDQKRIERLCWAHRNRLPNAPHSAGNSHQTDQVESVASTDTKTLHEPHGTHQERLLQSRSAIARYLKARVRAGFLRREEARKSVGRAARCVDESGSGRSLKAGERRIPKANGAVGE
jgi:hypothetical protein